MRMRWACAGPVCPFVQSPRNDLLDLHIFALIKMHKRFLIFFKNLLVRCGDPLMCDKRFHQIFFIFPFCFSLNFFHISQLMPPHNDACLFACYVDRTHMYVCCCCCCCSRRILNLRCGQSHCVYATLSQFVCDASAAPASLLQQFSWYCSKIWHTGSQPAAGGGGVGRGGNCGRELCELET